MRILALDLATNMAWACGPRDWKSVSQVQFGSVRLKQPAQTVEVMFRNYACWLRDRLTLGDVDCIAFEAPLNLGAMANSGISNAQTIVALHGLAAITNGVGGGCYGIRVKHVTPQQARKAVLGVGRPDDPKTAVKIWARNLGWMVKNDDEADALVVHWWCAGEFGRGKLIA